MDPTIENLQGQLSHSFQPDADTFMAMGNNNSIESPNNLFEYQSGQNVNPLGFLNDLRQTADSFIGIEDTNNREVINGSSRRQNTRNRADPVDPNSSFQDLEYLGLQSKQYFGEAGAIRITNLLTNLLIRDPENTVNISTQDQINQENETDIFSIPSVGGGFAPNILLTVNAPFKAFESYFNPSLKDETLTLECQVKKKETGNLNNLNAVKHVVVNVPYLHLDDEEIIHNLREFFRHLQGREGIILDFENLKQNPHAYEKMLSRLTDIFQIVFNNGHTDLKKIQVFWEWDKAAPRPNLLHPADFLLQYVSRQFYLFGKSLEDLSITILKTITIDIFREFIQRLVHIEERLTKFKLETYLDYPEEKEIGKVLNLPLVANCTLKLTYSGAFSNTLMTFIQNSLLSMQALKTLVIEINAENFPRESISGLFRILDSLPCGEKLKNLTVTIYQDRPDKESKQVCLEGMMRVASQSFQKLNLTYLKMAIDSVTATELNTKNKITKRFKELKSIT